MTAAFIVRQEGVVLVDSGTPGSEGAILRACEEHGIRPGDITLILLTHCHADHAGSARALREMTGAKIAIHKKDAAGLITGEQGELRAICTTGRLLGRMFAGSRARFPAFEPDIVFDDSLDLLEFGVGGIAVPTPGHTPGSVSVLLSNKEAIVGDLIVPKIPSGRPGYPFWADNVTDLRASIAQIQAYRPDKIYLAHGAPYEGSALDLLKS